jgi:hypothetical protein
MKMWSLSFFARNLKWSVLTSHGLAISRKDGIAPMKGKNPKKERISASWFGCSKENVMCHGWNEREMGYDVSH